MWETAAVDWWGGDWCGRLLLLTGGEVTGVGGWRCCPLSVAHNQSFSNLSIAPDYPSLSSPLADTPPLYYPRTNRLSLLYPLTLLSPAPRYLWTLLYQPSRYHSFPIHLRRYHLLSPLHLPNLLASLSLSCVPSPHLSLSLSFLLDVLYFFPYTSFNINPLSLLSLLSLGCSLPLPLHLVYH